MSARRKSPAQPAPQTLEQAIALLGRFAGLSHQLAGLEADRAGAKARIDEETDQAVTPIALELDQIHRQLKPWWAVAGAELTAARRKSIELGGCLIGERTGNPRLLYPKPETNAVQLLAERAFDRLLRIKRNLDKPAILKLLGVADDAPAGEKLDAQELRDLGFRANQPEEFFVEALPQGEATGRTVSEGTAS